MVQLLGRSVSQKPGTAAPDLRASGRLVPFGRLPGVRAGTRNLPTGMIRR